MCRGRCRTIGLGLLLAAILSVCAGCDPVSFWTGFGAGYITGQALPGPVEVTTVERMCYHAGERVPCPD